MSLDYPDRDDWLRVRATKPRKPRYLHISTGFIHTLNPDGTKSIRVARGRTYRKPK